MNAFISTGEYIFDYDTVGTGYMTGYCIRRPKASRLACVRRDREKFMFRGVNDIPNFKVREIIAFDHYGNGEYIAIITGEQTVDNRTLIRTAAVQLDSHGELKSHKFYNNATLYPTVVAQKSSEEMYSFFGPFWQLQRVDPSNILITLNKSQAVHLSTSWSSCPPSICFDSQLDGVTVYNGNTYLFRGNRYHFVYGSIGTDMVIKRTSRIAAAFNVYGYITAAMSVGNVLKLFREHLLFEYDGVETKEYTVVGRYNFSLQQLVDAAFYDTKNSSTYLFSDGQVYIYETALVGAYTRTEDRLREGGIEMQAYFKGMAKHIDAGHVDDAGIVYLFCGNYVYTTNLHNRMPMIPLLAAEVFYGCGSENYTEIEADTYLGIKTLADFKLYSAQFMDRKKEDTATSTTTRSVAKNRSVNKVDMILISIGVVMATFVVAFIVWCVWRKSHGQDEPIEISSLSDTSKSKGVVAGSVLKGRIQSSAVQSAVQAKHK